MNVRVENSQTVNRQTALLDTMTVSVSMSLETFQTLGVSERNRLNLNQWFLTRRSGFSH